MIKPSFIITENARVKVCNAQDYNYVFDKVTGNFARWGSTKDIDPRMAPCPEIADIEISTACDGVGNADGMTGASPCKFCYKSNKRVGEQMSIDTFKLLFSKLPKTVSQIAFGIGNLYGHDDMWKIFDHARENGVIPNVTINGWKLTDEVADHLVRTMGAIAVSRYNPKDICYDAVKKLTDRGFKQCNIHALMSASEYNNCMTLLEDMQADPRLTKLNAVVFLMLKPKGRGSAKDQMKDAAKYKELVHYALDRNLRIGFDSCSVPSFLNAVEDHVDFKRFDQSTDRCESGLFSMYIDVKGKAWPCSFGANLPDLTPIDVLTVADFERDVWQSDAMIAWRGRLESNKRSCPLWDIDIKQEK